MALLYISEGDMQLEDRNGRTLPLFAEPAVTTQRVSFTTAAQSAAFGGKTKILRIYSDTACNILFGSNPTALATSPRFAAGVEYFRAVRPGDKLSVYDGSS